MNTRTLFATAALLGTLFAGQAAFAADPASYPRTVGTGENIDVVYGPAGEANVVGGGLVQFSKQGEETTASYRSSAPAQQRAEGVVPVTVGSGENIDVVYLRTNGQNG